MSTQTVVDVIVSGTTTTVVDKRVDGITTVAGASPITEVTGQRPDLGVKTCLLGGEGDILSLTNDIAQVRANLIVTGTTLTDEIGVLSGHLITTGNNLEFQLSTLSGNLIASGNNLDSLRDILSGNLITTGNTLQNIITGATGDISTITQNLISTGNNLESQILNSGDITDDISGNLITTGQTLTNNLISTGNTLQPQIDTIEGNLTTTGQTLLTTGANLQALIIDNANNLIDTGNNLEPRINTNVANISTLNTATGVLSTATGELQEYKFSKSGGTISGSILPSSSGSLNLGSPSLTFQTGYFDDLEVGSNTLFIGGVPIKSINGGINFFDATGTTTFRDVSIRNLTVTGTETIIDVEHLAVKDNIIIINSGESGAGIGVRSGGLVIDRGTLPAADFLFNENTDRFEFNFPLAVDGNVVVTQNQTGAYASASDLIQTGVTLQNQITSNDTDIASLEVATGELKTQSNATDSNLITTGQTLTSEIAIVSGIAGGSTFDALSGNLITTGQTLTSEIAIVSGMAGGSDLATLSGNLITTGQTLQTQITSNDSDISTLTSNLVTTGSRIDSVSGNLITTGQTLQAQVSSNDSDIATLTSNLRQTGVNVTNLLIETGFAILDTSGNANTISGNLISTGKYLTDEIATVSGMATGGAAADIISGDLITTGQTLTSEIGIVSGLTVTNTNNLISTGNNLQGQITSNDGQIAGIIGDLVTTGQTLTTNINSVSSNLITTGQTLTSEIAIVSGIATGGSAQDFRELSGNLITTGQTLQTQITSNDGDITNLTSNLITTGQTLTSEIAIVSGLTTGSSSDPDLSGKVDTLSGNLISTGKYLTDEIAIVSGLAGGGDIDTLSGNLITTGQTLTTNINSVSSNLVSTGAVVDDISGNLITTGQTLQTQITSNDSDITNLTSNLITTGQTLTTDVNTVSGLITDNDADITALKSATGVLKTSTDNNTTNLITTGSVIDDVSGNLITTGQTLQTQITSNDNDISNITSNLVTTGQTLQTQITSNDSDISTLTSNLITTGQTLTDEIAIVSGIATGGSEQDFRELSGNLITTGQTLQTQITNNDSDISTLTSNLVTTGQTLTTNVNTVSSNLISTGAVVDDISGNLITTGQTLQTQITSNDGDITTLTSNLVTTGQTLTTNINTVASNLGTSGQTLQTQITSNDSDIASLTTNLGTTGQTLQTQITSNDSDISTLDSTTVKLTTNQSIAGNKIFTNDVTINNLTVTGTEVIVDVENLAVKDNIIEINSGESGAGISRISGGITIDRGSATNANILYNDANDRFELNFPLAVEGEVVASASNLITTGQTLTTNINTVSTNLGTSGQTLQTQITSNDSDISTLTTNLGTTGQTLQTQITSNDSDITTLTSNLVTTGQTLTTNINTVSTNLISTGKVVDDISGNLITTGQTLQTQITSNDTDITNLSSNLVTTGQTLTTNINTVATNLVTTGQTLTSEIATVSGLIPATVIDGGGTANKVPLWSDANTIGDSVISQSSSKIGIGTATPSAPLHVAVDGTSEILLERTTALAGQISQIRIKSVGSEWSLANNLAGNGKFSIRDVTDSRHVMVFDGDGKVGIGNTAPGEKLEVVGNIFANVSNAGGFMLTASSTSGLVRNNATGVALRTGSSDRLVVDASGVVTTNKLEPLNGNDTGYLGSSSKKWKEVYFGILEADTATFSGALNFNNGSDNCLRIEADAGKDVYINSYGSGNFIQFKQNSAAVLSLYETFLAIPDSTQLRFGGGSDLRFYHDGNNSYIWQVGVGALNIKSSVTDGNIVFTADRGDGGGTFDYFSVNGGDTTYAGGVTTAYTKWPDNSRIALGGGKDLQLYHDGSNSHIKNTGSLYVASETSGDLHLRSDNDATLDVAGIINLDADGAYIYLKDAGTSVGLFKLTSSDFYIKSTVSDKDIIFQGNDGGSTVTALTLDMSDSGTAIFNHDIKLADNGKAIFGGGSDLQIYHSGADSYIVDSGAGDLYIRTSNELRLQDSTGTDNFLYALEGGDVRLYYDGAQKLATASTGVTVTGLLTSTTATFSGNITQTTGDLLYSGGINWDIKHTGASQNIVFSTTPSGGSATERLRITHDGNLSFLNDTSKIKMGLGSDLQIYHDGGNSYISESGTGALVLQSNGTAIVLEKTDGENMILANTDGDVKLYYNGSEKLATTSTGITVTGAGTFSTSLKAATILDASNSAGTSGQILTSTGSALDWKTLGEISGVDGTGTAGYLSKWTDADTIGNSVIVESSSKIGIGTTTPDNLLTLRSASQYQQDLKFTVGSTAVAGGFIGAGGASENIWMSAGAELTANSQSASGFTARNNEGGGSGKAAGIRLGDSAGTITFFTASSLTNGNTFTWDGGSETGAVMSILNDGKVGIGTTSPAKTLELSNGTSNVAALRVARSTSLSDTYTELGTVGGSGRLEAFKGNIRIGADPDNNTSDSTIEFLTDNSVKMVIKSDGKVGIGTNAPTKLLHVHGSSPQVLVKSSDATDASVKIDAGAAQDSYLVFAQGGSSKWAFIHDYAGTDKLSIYNYANNANRVTFLPDGNVGIGTASPNADLEVSTTSGGELLVTRSGNSGVTLQQVNGGAATSGSLAIKAGTAISFSTNGTNQGLYINNQTYPRVGIGTSSFRSIGGLNPQLLNIEGVNSQWDSGLAIVSNAAGQYEAACLVLGRTGGTTAGSNTIVADNNVIGRLIFTAADGVDMRVTPAEIRSSVDDSSPAADSIKGDLEFYTNDGSSVAPISRLIITPTGNVGIGTSAPSAPLQIYGSDNQLLKVTSTDAYAEICISDNTTTSTTSSAIGVLGDRLYLYTGGGQRLSVLGDGNVGIGTTNPTFAAVSGNTVKGLNIQNVGQDTQASLRLTGHNASGNPGVATYTELLHAGANLRFDINHNGTVRFSIAPAGAITFNSAFTFPTADGSAGQVLQTNGSGTVTWASVTGGGGVSGSGTDNYIPRWNGTTALQDSSIVALDSGIVGIGTNAPNAAGASTNNSILSLKGKATAYGGILELINYGTSGNGQSHGVIRFLDNTTENAQIEVLRHSAADDARMDFKTRATGGSLTTRLTIADDGNVGIGTNAPAETLHIDGTARIKPGTTGYFNFEGQGNLSVRMKNSSGNMSIGGASIIFEDQNSNTARMRMYSTGGFAIGSTYHSTDPGANNVAIEGKVGIGTTAPGAKLHVYGGNIRISSTDDKPQLEFFETAAARWVIGHSTAPNNYFAISEGSDVAASERLVIAPTTGSVGIGTASPAEILTLDSSSNTRLLMREGGSNKGQISAGGGGLYIQNLAGDIIFRNISDADTVRIKNDGKVGIGTTAPGSVQLDVRSTTVSGGSFDVQDSYTSITSGASSLWLSNSNQTAGNYIRINFADAVGGSSTALIAAKCTDHTNNYGDLQFWTRGSSGYGTRLHIDQEGSVGIGTTAPATPLHVWSTSYPQFRVSYNSTLYFTLDHAATLNVYGNDWYVRLNSSEKFRIKQDGNVGIGTNAPGRPLEVNGTGNASVIRVGDGDTDGGAAIAYIEFGANGSSWNRHSYMGSAGADSHLWIVNEENADIKFYANNAEKMVIKNDGKVGIGSTSPVAPLDVPRASDYKVIKLGDDITSHYVMTGNSDHTLTLTCGSYYQAEIIVTAHQTNGGTYNNLYIRGIWSNNDTSHHWDEIENVGSLTNSTFTITNGQNGATAASGEWKIVHDYVSGTFVKFTVRITDFYGTHAYTIS